MNGFAGWATWLALVAGLAATVTKVVDLIRNAIDKNDSLPKVTWNIVALAVGVAFCLGWSIEITEPVLKLVPALAGASFTGVPAQIISGLLLGGVAGFFHEVFDSISQSASLKRSQAG